MSVRATLILTALLAFGLPTGAAVYQQTQQTNNTTTEREIYIVQARSAQAAAEADGEIEAPSILDLSFEVPGLVQTLTVDEGSYVEAGDVIAILENEVERVDVATAQVDLERAQVDLADLVEIDEDDVKRAQARIDAAKDSYGFTRNRVTQEDIRAAELRLADAQQTVRAAEEARIRGGGDMVEEGVILLEAQIGEARFDAEIARLTLENLRTINNPQLGAAGAQIEQAEAELARVLAGPSEFEVTRAELAVETAEQALRQAEIALGRKILVAPADGVITNLQIETGQRIDRNDLTMQLVEDEPLHATVEVDEIDFRLVDIGLEGIVVLDALPGVTFPATVTRIAPEGREVGGVVIYETEVEVNEPDPRIRVGMSATAYFGVQPEDTTLVIPERFIQTGDLVSRVNLDGTISEVPITRGVTTPDGVEIISGLNSGDALVLEQQ